MNPILMLMNQLKMKNPQAYQFLEQAQKNKSNPQELFKQITKDYKPEQMEQIFNSARRFGMPDEIIKQMQQ